MKFRCERDTLADAIATAQRTVASRSGALPVLQDLRVTAADDGIELIGSDLEITNRVQVPAEVEEGGVAVVPKLLGEIVRRLEPGPVTVSVTGDEAVITAGRFSTSLRLKPAEDYPRLTPPDGTGVRVDAAAFAAALKQVVRAASKDDLRPILTGVLLTAHAGGCDWSPPTPTGWRCGTWPGSACCRKASACSLPPRVWPKCSGSPATVRSKSCCASVMWCSAPRGPK